MFYTSLLVQIPSTVFHHFVWCFPSSSLIMSSKPAFALRGQAVNGLSKGAISQSTKKDWQKLNHEPKSHMQFHGWRYLWNCETVCGLHCLASSQNEAINTSVPRRKLLHPPFSGNSVAIFARSACASITFALGPVERPERTLTRGRVDRYPWRIGFHGFLYGITPKHGIIQPYLELVFGP